MLILMRNAGESIIVGEEAEITITVLGVKGKQVRIGVSAPVKTPVHREEIYQRIQDEKLNNKSTESQEELARDGTLSLKRGVK